MNNFFQVALNKVLDREVLTTEEAQQTMNLVAKGEVSPVSLAAFLAALRTREETSNELLGFAKSFRAHAIGIDVEAITKKFAYPPMDTCGTGGDGKNTFNVSTVSAFVVAAAGVPVLKHGNRSVSSNSGSADLLKNLGVSLSISTGKLVPCALETGLAFLFAPNHHPAMKYVAPVRKEMGVRTVFNILGPLLHPANVKNQLIGTFSEKMAELMAKTLLKLGSRRFFVVHSEDGYDEISVFGPTTIWQCQEGETIKKISLSPEDLGLRCQENERKNIEVQSVEESANIALSVLQGDKGTARKMVLINAAAALVVSGMANNMKHGVEIATDVLDAKKGLDVLEKLRKFTHENE